MTPQEQQALEGFLTQLTQASAGAKDAQADALITAAAARQPDAAYLLVQRAMLLDHAIETAKARITTLEAQLQAAQANGSGRFLDAENAWGNNANRAVPGGMMPPPTQMAPSPAQQPGAGYPPAYQQPTMQQAAPAQPARSGFFGGGLGGTLGGIATTAAGVAGGAFLFQGIENLFHHNNGGGSGFLGQSGSGQGPAEETVVNNFYGDNARSSSNGQDNGNLDAGLSDTGLTDDDFLSDDDSYNV